MQNCGLRIVYNVDAKMNEDELHTEAGLTLLKYRRIMHLSSITYHRSQNVMYTDTREIRTHEFGEIKLRVINPVVKKAFKSPNYYAVSLCYMLLWATQGEHTYNGFKSKVKAHIAAGM